MKVVITKVEDGFLVQGSNTMVCKPNLDDALNEFLKKRKGQRSLKPDIVFNEADQLTRRFLTYIENF